MDSPFFFPPHIFSEVPSAPSIVEVRAFSTTAQIQFEEPESNGGVPVLKYRAQWRIQGRGSWAQGVYDIQQGQIKVGAMLFGGNKTSVYVYVSAIETIRWI